MMLLLMLLMMVMIGAKHLHSCAVAPRQDHGLGWNFRSLAICVRFL
jgi:hypothetical protein